MDPLHRPVDLDVQVAAFDRAQTGLWRRGVSTAREN
jgi:hypothetical protein